MMHSQSYATVSVDSMLREADPRGELAPCGLRRLVLGRGALARVADTVAELLEESQAGSPGGGPAQVAVLVDPVTITREGADLKRLVTDQLRERFEVRMTVLDDGTSALHVVDQVLGDAARAIAGADAVVAVGGGTVSDIAKLAARANRETPAGPDLDDAGARPVLVVVQTAASVDGYTDDVSVVLRDGVKRTVPSCWPDGVIADVETIAEAPAAMNRAGFGEMTSMLVATADWRLASLVGVDSGFHPSAVRLLDRVGADIDQWSHGLREAEPGAVEGLTRALALRGVVSGVAGTTAALSGVEHLISHMLDLHHAEHHLEPGLHGAQVGAASVVAAAAWETCLERMASSPSPRLSETTLDRDAARERVEAAFAATDPTGRIARECWRDYARKLEAVNRLREPIERMLADWPSHEAELGALARPSAVVARRLRAAGAAAQFDELEPPIAPELARWAVAHCALMRNRFTVVDLLAFLGWWGDDDVTEVMDRARRSVAAAGDGAAGDVVGRGAR